MDAWALGLDLTRIVAAWKSRLQRENSKPQFKDPRCCWCDVRSKFGTRHPLQLPLSQLEYPSGVQLVTTASALDLYMDSTEISAWPTGAIL